MDGAATGLLDATFVAALVEFVEALTIVLAMGMTRSRRSAGGLKALLGEEEEFKKWWHALPVRRSFSDWTGSHSPCRSRASFSKA